MACALQVLHRIFSSCIASDDMVCISAWRCSVAENHDFAQGIARQDHCAQPFPASSVSSFRRRSSLAIVISPVLLLSICAQVRIAVAARA